MPGLEVLTGPTGGLMAVSYAGGWACAIAAVLPLWKKFGESRIDELKAEVRKLESAREDDKRDHEEERRRDREECRGETRALRDRITQLEHALDLLGAVRQASQAAISETRVRVDHLQREIDGSEQ